MITKKRFRRSKEILDHIKADDAECKQFYNIVMMNQYFSENNPKPHFSIAKGVVYLLDSLSPTTGWMERAKGGYEIEFLDSGLDHVKLFVCDQYTTSFCNGKESTKRYDLVSSAQDRHDILAWLLSKWKHETTRQERRLKEKTIREQYKAQRKSAYGIKSVSRGKPQAAAAIMERHQHKRLGRHVEQISHKSSPLGVSDSNIPIPTHQNPSQADLFEG